MKLFHASPTPGIQWLEPRVSNHGQPRVYFSDRWENVLVYLSNAVEKYCRETGFPPQRSYRKWGSYGFTKDGVLCLEEYYPDATTDTYRGVPGYIYTAETAESLPPLPDIPHAYFSDHPVKTASCQFIPDAYEALLQAAREKKILLKSYAENDDRKLQWIENGIRQEYELSREAPEYRVFLEGKFQFLSRGKE